VFERCGKNNKITKFADAKYQEQFDKTVQICIKHLSADGVELPLRIPVSLPKPVFVAIKTLFESHLPNKDSKYLYHVSQLRQAYSAERYQDSSTYVDHTDYIVFDTVERR
jgi:hypothetical protein